MTTYLIQSIDQAQREGRSGPSSPSKYCLSWRLVERECAPTRYGDERVTIKVVLCRLPRLHLGPHRAHAERAPVTAWDQAWLSETYTLTDGCDPEAVRFYAEQDERSR